MNLESRSGELGPSPDILSAHGGPSQAAGPPRRRLAALVTGCFADGRGRAQIRDRGRLFDA